MYLLYSIFSNIQLYFLIKILSKLYIKYTLFFILILEPSYL